MYLTAKKYLSKFDEDDLVMREKIANAVEDFNKDEISYVQGEVGYWRKANAIHGWIVENVQDGIDECQESIMSTADIEKLRELCVAVRRNHDNAEALLPVKEGFFFGGYDYDEWYFDYINQTIKILDKALALIDKGYSIYYQSSW